MGASVHPDFPDTVRGMRVAAAFVAAVGRFVAAAHVAQPPDGPLCRFDVEAEISVRITDEGRSLLANGHPW